MLNYFYLKHPWTCTHDTVGLNTPHLTKCWTRPLPVQSIHIKSVFHFSGCEVEDLMLIYMNQYYSAVAVNFHEASYLVSVYKWN